MKLLFLLLLVPCILAHDHKSHETELSAKNFNVSLGHFSLECLQQLEFAKKNVIFSPLSIGMALGILLEGAQGDARKELFKVLHLDDYSNKDTVHQRFHELLDAFRDMSTRAENKRNASVEIANLALIKEGLDIPKTFIDAVRKDYEANVDYENFAANGEAIRLKINKFVEEKTHGLIKDLFSQPLDPLTLMVIINTVYFKGYWRDIFNPEFTVTETFYNADKTESKVPLMKRNDDYRYYAHSDKLKAGMMILEYKDGLSMMITLPDEKDGLPKLIENLKNEDMNEFFINMKMTNVDIALPKFSFDYSVDLLQVLPKMGANIQNSLTALNPALKITGALHKAKIETHEVGTEAAAVTVILAAGSALKPPPVPFKADHPFWFSVVDEKSGVVLFSGTVNQL